MELVQVVAHQRFDIEKKNGPFGYEIQLERHSISGLYRIRRRWAYLDQIDQAPFSETDWHLRYKEQYKRKVFQKTEIMKYNVSSNFTQKPLVEGTT